MKTLTKFLSILAVFLLGVLPAGATINFNLIGGETIFSDNGTTMAPSNSLVLLVADTTGGGFGNLDVGNITVGSTINTGGNDLVVGLLSIYNGQPGLLYSTFNTSLFGAWDAGDPLAIYWIPSLTISNTTVGSGVSYGWFTDSSAAGGSAAWITPADGSNVNPLYFSTVSDIFGEVNAASNAGYASLSTSATVVPEPSTFGLLGGLLALGVAFWRRRQIPA